MKQIILYLLLMLLMPQIAFSSECENSAIIWEAVFSINDPTFNQSYDGSSGIIQKISRNDETNDYSLWQTTNLSVLSSSPVSGGTKLYGEHGNNENDFKLDSNFNANKNNMLIINSNHAEFDFYYKITLKNTGTCHYSNEAVVGSHLEKSLRYYGMNNFNSYSTNSISPNNAWIFDDAPQNGLKSKTYKIAFRDVENFGKAVIRIGPDNPNPGKEFQRIDAYFWLDGPAGYCGDGIKHSTEECDDGNNINGDLCSASCEVEMCEENIEVDTIEYALNSNNFNKEYDGNDGLIQKITQNFSSDKFSLWQTPLLNSSNRYPWGPNAKVITYKNHDMKNDIFLDSDFDNENVLHINENNSNNFNLYYKITLRNTGTCSYTDDAEINRRYGHKILNYGAGAWNNYYKNENNPRPNTWYPNNVEPNETVSREFQVKNSGMINYGRIELRVGPHDRKKYSGEEHFQYLESNFLIDLPGPICGNNIKEYGEGCDGTDTPLGSTCSSSCNILPSTPPIIKWENDVLQSQFHKGDNLNPGDTFIVQYSAENTNSENMSILFDSLLYTEYYAKNNYWGEAKFFSDDLRRDDVSGSQKREIINIPGNTKVYFNRTVTIPNYSEERQNTLFRFYYYERFKYKKASDSSYYYKKASDGNNVYNWWQNSTMKDNSRAINWKEDDYLYSPWGNDGGWMKRGYGIGSYNPLYAIRDLDYQPSSIITTVSSEGIPALQATFYNGLVHSSYKKKIPSNTFYLDAELINHQTGEVYQRKAVPIEKEFERTDGDNIRPNKDYSRDELRVKQTVIFQLDDFSKYNDKKLKIRVTPKLTRTNQTFNLPQGDLTTPDIRVDLNDPIGVSVDNPIELYPNGPNYISDIYQRFLLFNYLEYALFGVNISVNFLDSSDTSVNHLYEFDINSTSSIIPAGASYPLGIKINYTGPTASHNIDNHQIELCMDYYDPEKEMNINEWRLENGFPPMCKKTDLKVYTNSVSTPFSDLIPRDLTFTLLNLNNESITKVTITNQGTLDVTDPFPVDLYVKSVHEDEFTHIDRKTISSLNAGESKTIDFVFIPDYLGNFIIKSVVDEDDVIYEDESFIADAENNNFLTSIAVVRDLDVFLENVIIDYENAQNGIIPIKVFASNKGVGGIDSYELKLTLRNSDNTYQESKYFIQIPEEGKEVIYELNTTNLIANSYNLEIELIAPFDPDMSDNYFESEISFCPNPWKDGNKPLACNTFCTSSCINPQTGRYLATCHEINGCMFRDSLFAESCNEYLEGTYAPFFDEFGIENTTHLALCPEGIVTQERKVTGEDIDITGDCDEIIIRRYLGILEGEDILINIVECSNN